MNLGGLFSVARTMPLRRMYEEALPHHQAAVQANPRNPEYRQFFRNNRQGTAQALVELGEHRAAVAAFQLLEAAVDPVDDAYKAACYFARCVHWRKKTSNCQTLNARSWANPTATKPWPRCAGRSRTATRTQRT